MELPDKCPRCGAGDYYDHQDIDRIERPWVRMYICETTIDFDGGYITTSQKCFDVATAELTARVAELEAVVGPLEELLQLYTVQIERLYPTVFVTLFEDGEDERTTVSPGPTLAAALAAAVKAKKENA